MNIQPLKDWWGDRPSRPPGSLIPQHQSMNLGGDSVGGTLDNEQALSQAIRQALLTRLYQVPQKLGFGSRLTEYLDKPTSATSGLTREIREVLATWEKRIQVRKITVEPSSQTGGLIIRVTWSPTGVSSMSSFETMVNV